MKKQYIYGYSNEKNNSKEKYTVVFLVGMCIAAALITFLVVVISKKMNKTQNTDILLESKQGNDVQVISSEEVHNDAVIEEESEIVSSGEAKSYLYSEEVSEENEETETEVLSPQIEEEYDEGYQLPCQGKIIMEYSPTVPVYSATLDDWRVHNGVDIYASLGEDVLCIADGTVHSVSEDFRYGNTVVVQHENNVRSVYSNLDNSAVCKVGDKIKKGSVIARVGDTALFETVADTHLHFEMLIDGNYVNPMDYLNLK